MRIEAVLQELESLAKPEYLNGKQRFGINTRSGLGIRTPDLRSLARKLGKDHSLALNLWATGIHEARMLAGMIDLPDKLTLAQMDSWVQDFDSWDLCDQTCSNLFCRSPLAWERVNEWAQREEEFVRRAAFVLIATLAIHQKKIPDSQFLVFFPLLEAYALDDRNFVKKAVNWALRQLGKRSSNLRIAAIETAHRIRRQPTRSARWIASDALRELAK
jgi:3-methyladenine DNA glycosylase AlkD